jgi:drug/metabolite transporter (DMT)-like permease
MSPWLLLAVGGQFLNALVAILDKYIVTDEKVLPRPFVYAFYSCLLTGFWALVYVFAFIPGLAELGAPSLANVQTPSIQVVGMSFLAAYTFFMALVSMYDALKHGDTSDVMPVIGAVSAIFTFLMSYLFLGAPLSPHFLLGVSLLVVGTFLVSSFRFNRNMALHTFHSGLFFALHYIAMKGLFQETSFDDGFFWSRVGFVLFALSLLLVPVYYDKIKNQTVQASTRSGFLVLSAKVLAGVGAFMLLKATDMGDVTVVQALDGLKFVFIILIGLVVGRFIPHTAGENEFDAKTVVRKVLYVCLITMGVVLLFR